MSNKKVDDKVFQPKDTLCWTCQKFGGGCSWSQKFIPVKGWVAEQHDLKIAGGKFVDSYRVIKCPEYLKDKPRRRRK